MLAMLLIGMSRCASADLCPSDDALISALRERDNAFVAAASAQFAEEDPNSVTLVHSERIKDVRDVICGDALPGDLPTVTCKFTVRYWSRNAYQVARLVKKDGRWQVDEALTVMRKRK
ncbi:hypothetical protein [Sphingosinicella sp. BN140058]|uniref:hypothetical protein n=1 Tax=Sphingosinicella sp. BN140058 TaxID=1892855 RepID=UPI0010120C2E|nr:hypothetical protein [Sphingosinicella sp. BN140058]QAY78923.1 hypothetical protein ETR14_22070 [Sphingosinicella sp. BN140058]